MSKTQTKWDKVKLYYRFFKKDLARSGTVVTCGFCTSGEVEFSEQKEDKTDTHVNYESVYTCKGCGAVCKNVQNWTMRKGDGF